MKVVEDMHVGAFQRRLEGTRDIHVALRDFAFGVADGSEAIDPVFLVEHGSDGGIAFFVKMVINSLGMVNESVEIEFEAPFGLEGNKFIEEGDGSSLFRTERGP